MTPTKAYHKNVRCKDPTLGLLTNLLPWRGPRGVKGLDEKDERAARAAACHTHINRSYEVQEWGNPAPGGGGGSLHSKAPKAGGV